MPKRYIPALLIFFALIGSTVYFYHQESSYLQHKNIVAGVVVGYGTRSTSSTTINGNKTTVNTQALVDFQVNGATYRAEGRAMGYPRWQIGQAVEVYYSAENPRQCRINRWDELYFFTILSGFFLIAGVVFGTINFIVYKVRDRPLS